ncbi:Ig-like domain-containing protein, partial [Aureimonas ureilytica]|uniref:Ig-like domain-containing protein n=1 Tax=Aureimonas ureilytica TaxID=401562 RepID=UPI00187C32D0
MTYLHTLHGSPNKYIYTIFTAFLVLFSSTFYINKAKASSCAATLNFSAVGETITENIQSCNTFILSTSLDTSNSRWAGLQENNGDRVRGPSKCGVGVTNGSGGSCSQPTAYTLSTSDAVFEIFGDSSTSIFSIKLLSRTNISAFTYSKTFYTYIGPDSASIAASKANTPYVFNFSVAADGVASPQAGNATATVTANSGAIPVTLALSGGAAASVAIATPASHGTATASGTSITYTPNTGYSGADSFTYTATNASGTSAPATVSVTVNAAVPGAPTIGSASAGDAQASVTFTPPASNGGAAITSYTVTSTPGGLAATGASSPITVAGLTNGTSYTFTVTATNSAGKR